MRVIFKKRKKGWPRRLGTRGIALCDSQQKVGCRIIVTLGGVFLVVIVKSLPLRRKVIEVLD